MPGGIGQVPTRSSEGTPESFAVLVIEGQVLVESTLLLIRSKRGGFEDGSNGGQSLVASDFAGAVSFESCDTLHADVHVHVRQHIEDGESPLMP